MLKGKRIAVTGGCGFLGSHLIEELKKQNPKKIYCVDLLNNEDLTDFEEIKLYFESNKIDVVFHLATLPLPLSLVKPLTVVSKITQMTTNLCELCRLKKFKTLIQMSSSEAYGSALTVPMSETHPLNPTTPYAAAKASADLILLSYYKTFGIDTAIVRGFNLYGARQPEELGAIIPKTIHSILTNKPIIIYGDGSQTRDFTYVKDMVNGIIKVYNHPKTRGKIINIASGKETTIKELVVKICYMLDYHRKIKHKKSRIADVRRHYADITLARELLHYRPQTTLDEGLFKTIKYYVHNLSITKNIYQ